MSFYELKANRRKKDANGPAPQLVETGSSFPQTALHIINLNSSFNPGQITALQIS